MDLKLEGTGAVAVVQLPGDYLDMSNAAEFKQAMECHLRSGARVVLDLGKVQILDSSGLGAILWCKRQLDALGGGLRLCRMQRPVRVLVETMRMHRVLDIADTPEEAAHAFEPAAT
jgi:anti-sigma B factor antagonist